MTQMLRLGSGMPATAEVRVSMYFLISSLISSVISWLFSSALFSLHVFVVFTVFSPVIDFQSHSIVVRKDA